MDRAAPAATTAAVNAARPLYGNAEVTVEFLGVDRKLELLTDSAPAEPAVDYPGYFHIVSVKLNGVEIVGALSEDDLRAIAEEIK